MSATAPEPFELEDLTGVAAPGDMSASAGEGDLGDVGIEDYTKVPLAVGHCRRGVHLSTGEEISLFLDTRRQGIPASSVNVALQKRILKSVARNAEDLLFWLNECIVLSEGRTLGGAKAEEMLHVMMLCVEPGRSEPSGEFLGFVPGPVRTLEELIKRFGGETTKEIWIGIGRDDDITPDLDGLVRWWHQVGVMIDSEGEITHLLLRGPVLDGPDR